MINWLKNLIQRAKSGDVDEHLILFIIGVLVSIDIVIGLLTYFALR